MLGWYTALLWLWLVGPTTGEALSPYRGLPVLSIDIDAPKDANVQELRPLITIEPGYLLSTEDLEASVKRLCALGRFADVGVTAERHSGTVSLHFFVQPLQRLENLLIEGIQDADIEALQKVIHVSPGDEVDHRTAEAVRQQATQYLRTTGFPKAKVKVHTSSGSTPGLMSLVVGVKEGRPSRIRDIRFTGTPRISIPMLSAMIQSRPGNILNLQTIETDRLHLLQAFRARGFFQAEVTVAPDDHEAAVVVFHIVAGERFFVLIEGNSQLSTDVLLSLWPGRDSPWHPSYERMFVENIRQAYLKLGYLDAQVASQIQSLPSKQERYIFINIQEGLPYRLGSLTFEGARVLSPTILEQQVRSYLRRKLEAESFFQKMTAADRCLSGTPVSNQEFVPALSCTTGPGLPENRFVPTLYQEAINEIQDLYRDLGYLEATVGPIKTTRDNHKVYVHIPVQEGPCTHIDTIAFTGNEAFSAAQLFGLARQATVKKEGGVILEPGAPWSISTLEEARIAILRQYRDSGFLYALVFTQITPRVGTYLVDLVIHVQEGPEVRVEQVLVQGNHYTKPEIIRDRMETKAGDVYRLNQALEDQRALSALGVFSRVRVRLIDEEKPGERKDLVAEVEERKRHQIDARLGFSSAEGPRVSASYAYLNLGGIAAKFNANAQLNRQVLFDLYGQYSTALQARYKKFSVLQQIERHLRVGFQSPELVNLPGDPSARFDLVNERNNTIPYAKDATSAIFGFDIKPYNGLLLRLEPQVFFTDLDIDYSVSDIYYKSKGTTVVPTIGRRNRPMQAGRRTTFEVGPTITWDQRDDPFNPMRGYYIKMDADYAQGREQVGNDPFSFFKVEGNMRGYVPWWRLVFAASASAGFLHPLSQQSEPIDERFYLGGRTTLRGFPEGETLIPEDACVVRCHDDGKNVICDPLPVGRYCNDPLPSRPGKPPVTHGGNMYVLLKGEIRILMTEDFSLALFVDAGNLWIRPPNLKNFFHWRVGTGAGLRFNTPIGPLTLDLGINTRPRTGLWQESTKLQPHFSVGVF